MTRKRITIMMDAEIYNKLRTIQSTQIKKTNNSVSFSNVVEQMLVKSIKK